MTDKKAAVTDLETWFSAPRLRKYREYSVPEEVYRWNAQVTKELLVDIGHLEVLLRNAVDEALNKDSAYGKQWFCNSALQFAPEAKKSVDKAIKRVTKPKDHSFEPGRVIAELPFDFWRYLFSKRYQTTVWPKFAATLPRKVRQTEFEKHLHSIYISRNRFSHHEPLITGQASLDKKRAMQLLDSIDWLASLISETAAQWIHQTSSVNETVRGHPEINQ